jgi:hypothetical protein
LGSREFENFAVIQVLAQLPVGGFIYGWLRCRQEVNEAQSRHGLGRQGSRTILSHFIYVDSGESSCDCPARLAITGKHTPPERQRRITGTTTRSPLLSPP